MEPWAFLLALLLTAAVAGGIGAILGLGGGILLVPTLTMFYGVSLRYAMGASIISVIATSSGAAAAYLRTWLSNIRIGLFLAMATVSGAIVGAGLVGLVPESVLELILGLALAYSTLVTLRQLNVEIPAEPRVDPLAMSFADGGHGEEEPDAHVAEPRPEIGGGRAARRGDDGDDAGAHRVAQVDAVEHREDRHEHDAAAEAEDRADRPRPHRGGEDGGEEEPLLHLQPTRNGGGSPPPWCITLIAPPRNRSISRHASTRYQLRKKPMLAMKPAWALSRPNSSSATHAATSPNRVRPWPTMAAWMARGASPSGDDVPVQTSSSLHWSFQARGGVSETEATDRCPPHESGRVDERREPFTRTSAR